MNNVGTNGTVKRMNECVDAPRTVSCDGDTEHQVVTASASEDDGVVSSTAVAEDVMCDGMVSSGTPAMTDAEDAATTVRDGTSGDDGLDADTKTAERLLLERVSASMNERDGERAQRYVATVRPAMAALRYASMHSRHPVEDLVDTVVGEVLQTGEGDTPQASEYGGNAASVLIETAPTVDDAANESNVFAVELGDELDDDAMARLGSIARVWMATKYARKQAKAARARRAQQRHVETSVGNDMNVMVEELDEAERCKRQQHAEAAYRELYERQEQR